MSNYNTSFPKKRYRCVKCGYIWEEFYPLKCPNCDRLFSIREVEREEVEGR